MSATRRADLKEFDAKTLETFPPVKGGATTGAALLPISFVYGLYSAEDRRIRT
jgi:hypothetical protein